MAGIYVHIPFCKQACHYCDFSFSTTMKTKDWMLESIQQELVERKDDLGGESIDTIYFGGGTPSLLTAAELKVFFETIHKHYNVSSNAEITLEANPDDLTIPAIRALAKSPINRLSIGIQSFREEDLKWMNRAHNAQEALTSVKASQDAGIEDISIDLIYGLPQRTNAQWLANLKQGFALDVKHLSAYCLTVEPGTALGNFVDKGIVIPTEDGEAAEQFDILLEQVELNGWEQYEISNFCRDGSYSRHNSSYWKGTSYLGVGPSAHSFDGSSRRWNFKGNTHYLSKIRSGQDYWESEEIDTRTAYNEYVMTGLRTKWGCDVKLIKQRFGTGFLSHFEACAANYFATSHLVQSENTVVLSKAGKRIADRIASDLFMLEE
jgi:oxygen-independent coproporphyrinogen-3 oxidase